MTAPQTPDRSPGVTARQAPERVGPERVASSRVSDQAPAQVPSAGAVSDDSPSAGDATSRSAVPAAQEAGGPPTARQPVVPDDGRVRRPGPPRPAAARASGERPSATTSPAGRTRKARLALKRIDPWSVFLFSLLASVFMGIALVVAVAALFTVLESIGVVSSINDLVAEVTGETQPLLTTSRFVGGAAVLGAVNIVLLTLLATLGAVLHNLCASLTGGIELTLGERDG